MRAKDLKDVRSSLGSGRPSPGSTAMLSLTEVFSGVSFSGHERDCLFLNQGARSFLDLSGVSGLDDPSDGRNLAIWDYDRDGWPDLATTNLNTPTLRIYHNDLGAALSADQHQSIAVRLVGGNRTSRPQPGLSARDAYGAKIKVGLGDTTLMREHHAGEGFAVQNSATLLIGIGARAAADTVTVRFPSGREHTARAVPGGTLLTVYEDPAQAPGGQPFVRAAYRVPPRPRPPAPAPLPTPSVGPRTLDLGAAEAGPAPLRLYLTMATWCGPCAREVPVLQRLRAALPESELAMLAVPVDAQDTPARLGEWAAQHRPPYRFLSHVGDEDVARVQGLVREEMYGDGMPAAIVTDRAGRVLHIGFGPPTVSQLRGWLKRVQP